MAAIIAVFLLALALSAAGMPIVRRAALALGFVDLPARRKVHQTPIPLLGGLGILLGALGAVVLLYRGDPPETVTGFLLATTVVALTGLWDDYRPLPAWAKLLGQMAGVAILVAYGIRVQLPVPEPLNYALTLLWLLGITNAINFLDNMDGLSAGVSAVAAAFLLLLGLFNDQFLVAGLSAALLGACLGFLRYNFPPARIFMGDVGSLFLGFSLAVLALQLRFPANSAFVTWMVPVFLLGLPIFDMTLVVVSRIRRGLSPASAGKDHTSHRLVQLGFNAREAVLILYLISGILGMMALFITQATLVEGYTLGAIGALLAGASIIWLERRWKEDSQS
jgi:UDP-GlcNAc:undecaprenyl-phosphate GlcNAc-1-phosphate transferase